MPSSDAANPASLRSDPVVVDRRVLHKGAKFDFESLTVRRPGGSIMQREIVRHPGAVVVVPVLPDGRLVLIRNYRISVGQWLLEFCAGTLEAAEDPAACAGRELVEETGYRAAHITPLGWFYTTPGLTDEKMHAFVASDLTLVGQDLEADENITVETLTVEQALAAIDAGELRDAKSITALLQAQRRGLLSAQPLRPGRKGDT